MTTPPLDFLLTCSGMSLADFELSRLALASKLRKQLRIIDDEMKQCQAEAQLARWLMENRNDLLAIGRASVLQESFKFISSAKVENPKVEPRRELKRGDAQHIQLRIMR